MRARALALASLIAFLVACSDRPTPADADGSVAEVRISGPARTLAVGQRVQLTATPVDASGNALLGHVVTWTSSNIDVATVSDSGVVTGVSAGVTTISAMSSDQQASAVLTVTSTPSTAETAVLVGAGDVGTCSSRHDEATAASLDSIWGTVFTTGDNAYPDGTARDFAECYAPSWGRHKPRTRPTPGNHDYHVAGAADYFAYFGAAAGEPGKGYYSYDLGAWHVVALNSEIDISSGSEQVAWLEANLRAHPRLCTVVYWHRPRFTSGPSGNDLDMQAVWEVLYEAGADVVLNGDEHNYERFAPQTPNGSADPARGIRQFVVGTGGASLMSFVTVQPNSEFRLDTSRGVLKLELSPTSYQWWFISTDGNVPDSGSTGCH